MHPKYKVKSTKENKFFEENKLSDVEVIDDSKYVLKGSEKQFVHICTVKFKMEHYVLFCEAPWLVEQLNRKSLGDPTFEFLMDSKYLQPKVYIEKVKLKSLPNRTDTISTYLERIDNDQLFEFLLNYFQVVGALDNFQIKAKS